MAIQQVWQIGGGDSYSQYEDFLEALKTQPLRTTAGDKTKRWTDSLAKDLGEAFAVFKPSMPNTDNAKYEEWKIWFERHCELMSDNPTLIGWSLGGMFLAKYFAEETTDMTPKSLFLLAAPCASYDDGRGNDCGIFRFDSDSLSQVPEKVGEIHILHSKDDFFVPYEHAEKYKAALPEATLHTFEDKNHFLVEELPELLQLIKEVG